MRKMITTISGLLLLAGCVSPIEIVDSSGEKYPGVPFPEIGIYKVPGQLQSHSDTKVGSKCNPVGVTRVESGPTGRILYARSGGNFFTSQELTVAFHSNGTVSSIGGDVSSVSSGVEGFIGGIGEVVGITKSPDPLPNCNTGFVPVGERELVGRPELPTASR